MRSERPELGDFTQVLHMTNPLFTSLPRLLVSIPRCQQPCRAQSVAPVTEVSHRQPSPATPAAYRGYAQPPIAIGQPQRLERAPWRHCPNRIGQDRGQHLKCSHFAHTLRRIKVLPKCPNERKSTETGGNTRKPAISGGFEKVEPRGIEPRSGDRTLVLLRA